MKPAKSCNALLALLGAGLLLAVLPARAILIVGTSLTDDGGSLGVGVQPTSTRPDFQWAVGFMMPGQSYTLTDVRLRLSQYDGPDDSIIGIYLDNGAGFPGAPHALLTDPAAAGSPDNYTFTPAGTVTLAASTKYWLLLDGQTDQNYRWMTTDDVPNGPATFDRYLFSSSGGISFSTFSSDDLCFEINGEPIAAPPSVPDAGGTLPLLGVALAGLTWFNRRRKRSPSQRT